MKNCQTTARHFYKKIPIFVKPNHSTDFNDKIFLVFVFEDLILGGSTYKDCLFFKEWYLWWARRGCLTMQKPHTDRPLRGHADPGKLKTPMTSWLWNQLFHLQSAKALSEKEDGLFKRIPRLALLCMSRNLTWVASLLCLPLVSFLWLLRWEM